MYRGGYYVGGGQGNKNSLVRVGVSIGNTAALGLGSICQLSHPDGVLQMHIGIHKIGLTLS